MGDADGGIQRGGCKWNRSGFGPDLQFCQPWAGWCQHMHSDSQYRCSDRRIERDTDEEQRLAHHTGVGNSRGGSYRRHLHRHSVSLHHDQSEPNHNRDPRQQYAECDDRSRSTWYQRHAFIYSGERQSSDFRDNEQHHVFFCHNGRQSHCGLSHLGQHGHRSGFRLPWEYVYGGHRTDAMEQQSI